MDKRDVSLRPADAPDSGDREGSKGDKKKIAVASDDEVAQYGRASDATPSPEEAGADRADETVRLRAECDEYRDKYLRAQAECANVSKRLTQQHAQSLKLAGMSLARALLPCLDNFHRTLDNIDADKAEDPIIAGVKLVAAEMEKVLQEHGVSPIVALGRPFDPALHQAMMQDVESDAPPETVTAELERGYMMHDRVLRPSKVVVSAKPSDVETGVEETDTGAPG